MAVLRALKGLNPGQVFPVEGDSAVLGRHPECDVVLEVGAISRQHARIVRVGESYFVEDLHSRNGTYLNEQRVEGRQPLKENDQIRICDLVFVFHHGPAPAGAPDSAAAPQSDSETTRGAMMVDDERPAGNSTVMSKVDISTGTAGLRLKVNAEGKLKALLEISQNLGHAVALDAVLAKILESLFAIFLQADRGFIVLKDPPSGRLVPMAVKCRREDTSEQLRISRTIVREVMATKQAVLSADAATDARFEMSESIVDFHIHSMMCAPLVGSDGQVLGVIQIDARDPRHRFTGEDLEVLAAVACQAAVAVENAQLHEIAVQEEILRRELDLAHKVQQGFLPAAPPRLRDYEFFDYYEPAQELGGDYFDYIPLPGNRLGVALADVSGKGIAAALLMAKLSAEMRYCLVSEPTPAAAVARLNRIFCESRWEDRFVTLALAVLDPLRHQATVVSAGHMPPLLRRADGQVESVGEAAGGLPVGVDNGVDYGQHVLALGAGDCLLMYTDGITDAMNVGGAFYGYDRLHAQLCTAAENVARLGQLLLDDVRRFVGSRPQTDDMCLTCFGRVREPVSP